MHTSTNNEDTGERSQPDGGMLSLLGDTLFAGAVLIMIYPNLSRLIKRVDRQFCRQILHIFQVIAPLAALSFVLMLMVAQQTRMAYCSLVQPLIKIRPDDGANLGGILMKVVFCALLGFNYIFARKMHRFVRAYSPIHRADDTPTGQSRSSSAATASCRRGRSVPREKAFPNNSNTNSPATAYSDIFSTVSTSPDRSNKTGNQRRLYCDVGTMAQFPDNQKNCFPTRFCPTQAFHQSSNESKPAVSLSLPCSPESPCPSSYAGSSGVFAVSSASLSTAASSSSHNDTSSVWQVRNDSSRCQSADSGSSGVESEGSLGSRVKSVSSVSNSCNFPGFSAVTSEAQEHRQTELAQNFPWDTPGFPPGGQNCLVSSASGHSTASSQGACPKCSFHSPSVTSCSSQTPLQGLTRQAHVVVRRRSHRLPTMIKMTRSGKIYGYG